jgi:hypothetical protein
MRRSVPTSTAAQPSERVRSSSGAVGRSESAFAGSDLRLQVLALCAAAFLLGVLPRMHWGFWTDEAATYWMAIKGWRAAIERTTSWTGQSVLYSIVESFFSTKGPWKEFLLRIPSVMATVAAAWQLKRIAEITIHRSAGWPAVAPFVCAPAILELTASARPYTLALAASLASFRYLLEWQEMNPQDSSGWRTLTKYLTASILTVGFHYLFGFIFLIQSAYLVFCEVRGHRVRLALPLAALIVLPASLLLVLPALRNTARVTEDYAHAAKPTLLQLFQLCFSPALLLGAGLGAVVLLVSARKLKWRPIRVRPEYVFLVLTWLTLAPVTFFLIASLTENSVFATRYLLFTLPAGILVIAWAVAGVERRDWRFMLLFAMFAGVVLHPGMLMQVFREGPASWRPPLEQIARSSPDGTAPVFMASGMASLGRLDWQEQRDPATSSMFAPLMAYPIANRTIPLPYQFSPRAQEFIRARMQGELRQERRLFLLAASDSPLSPWMSRYLQDLGYKAESTNFNDYVVVEFRRP